MVHRIKEVLCMLCSDKAWMCAGENDHIGNAGVVKSCPHRDEISKKREARRREELLAMEERQAASRLEKENLQEAKHRAEQRLAERQQSELERLRGQNVDEDKKEAVDEEEIKRRAANFGDGQKDPYGVLKLPKDSQMTDIRKALSLQFHPDKISDGRLKEAAQKAFMDVVAAYEILGDPDKRAAFDDLGGQDQAQFNTFWEWEMYGKKGSSNDFYNGETLISKLTESLWPRRVIGDAIWLVEFYAPWCTACGHFVSTYKNVAKALENDDIEVGAVNCVNEKGICGEWFSIGSYPSLMLIGSAERGTQQIYSQSQSKDPDSIISWARAVAKEWKWLYSQTDVPTFKTSSDFRDNVLGSLDLWFVVFTDGVFCGPCRTAITNLLRLGAGVAGLAKAAIVDCEADEMHGLCYDDIKLPPPPHSPEIRIFRKGPKDNTTAPNYYGECLFDAHDVQPHVALKLAELVARNALADEMPKEALFAAGGKGEYEDGRGMKQAERWLFLNSSTGSRENFVDRGFFIKKETLNNFSKYQM
ncbi:hypothetical protein GUITHDRAFT_113690 [Guillardia theta CCMP2712]|uniref:DnaJ homolog subfamily C member 10 n=1 Tax=Guillardia theta (strain CCMP2712) TaxID=905079 RepID=L1IWF6_GUITC|nr:hypothetical protein GUITHDRAFT_113690 [Guillardia theta CCMP2712]EKX40209.1 hypothetical protein GUITHDRAFT_113690 [Guillardia theta CCMP2712]|eukprot:XP_005827189.1 hypothetical protein GUITHDRAFT_113690 [Guillardia theta CCMP2712]